nr:hypothetical protein [Tanacetum cinerariifolium]
HRPATNGANCLSRVPVPENKSPEAISRNSESAHLWSLPLQRPTELAQRLPPITAFPSTTAVHFQNQGCRRALRTDATGYLSIDAEDDVTRMIGRQFVFRGGSQCGSRDRANYSARRGCYLATDRTNDCSNGCPLIIQ